MSLVLAVGTAVFAPAVSTPAQAATGDFACGDNYVYGTYYAAAGSTTTLYKINASTGATAATVGTFPANVSVNALAITADGDAAYAISTPASAAGGATLYKYGTGAVKTLSGLTANAGIPAGGYNPVSNDYWFATVDNSSTGKVSLYKVDLDSTATTVTFSTPTLTWTDANLVGASVGTDLTFDGLGRLYLVLSTNTTAFTNKVITFSPAQLSAGGAQTGTKLVDLDAGNATTTFPGVAFGSAGYLYTQGGTTLYESNPTNGAQVNTHTTALAFSDLGSCANPTIINAVRKNVVTRAHSGDTFTLSLSGTGFDTPLTATAATPATGIQNEQVASAVVLPNTTYAISETASGGANLNDYISSWQCVNDDTDAVVGSGTTSSGSFTTPDTRSTGKGVPVVCTITNEAKSAAIKLTKTAAGSPTQAGGKISYTFKIENSGNRPLTGITLSDSMFSAAEITCTPSLSGLTLARGDSATCVADHTVTQSDVEAGKVVNTASVTGTPPSTDPTNAAVTSTDKATVTIAQTAKLKIVKSLLSGNPYRVGDQLTYAFVVTNTGNVAVSGVSVNDDKVTGESCTPTTLAPGASANCSANTYTVTAADVTAGKVVNTAIPTGTSVAGTPSTDSSSVTSVTTGIGTLPAATADMKTTKQNTATSVDPLANDTAGTSGAGTVGTLVASSVVLVAGTGDTVSNGGKSLSNSDGVYTVDPVTGRVAFTPATNYVGTAKAVTYQVTDALGLTASSTITITVDPIVPKAVDDSASTAYLTPVTFGILTNDAAGDASVPLRPETVVFTASGTRTLTTAEGSYSVDDAGNVTFTPVKGFTGTTTPVQYSIADKNGSLAKANITVTVAKPPAPAATDDSGSGLQGSPVSVSPITNDTAGGAATLDASSIVLKQSDGSYAKTLVVDGKGTWTVGADGSVTFTPLPGFSGTVGAPYRIADELGQTATAKITVTITPVTPLATNDTNHAQFGTASVDTDVLHNDAAGDATVPLVPGSVVFGDGSTTLTNGDGTYTVDTATGHIAFAPNPGFSGQATPVAYRVADTNGTTASATLTVTIGNPPTAAKDAKTTPQNIPVTFNPLTNDAAGTDGAGQAGTLVAASVVFTGSGVTDAGKTLVLDGKGTFSINVTTGEITFTPIASYTGTTPEVPYAVTDSFGNTAASTVKVTVTPITPTAVADTNHAFYGTASVMTDVAANDKEGAASAPIVPASITFADGTATLTNADGTYTIDPVAHPGQITFTPVDGFSGTATPVTYVIADANGTTASSTLTVTIGRPPVASPDIASTPQDVNVTVSLLGNDQAGYDGTASGGYGNQGTKLPATVRFTSSAASADGLTLAVPGQGTYTIDPATGKVTFDPEPTFTGKATAVGYQFTDSYGNTAASTLTITVDPITPTAKKDTNHTPYGTPVTTTVLANDTEGASTAPLQADSVTITTGTPTDSGTKLVVAGQGTWTVKSDGTIAFAPADGFTGPAQISYQVLDRNGTPASATLTVTVGNPPTADDESGTTRQNENVTLDALDGDLAGDNGAGVVGTLDPASVRFTSGAATDSDRTLVTAEGTWTIDSANGKVTFDPRPAYVGTTAKVQYEVTDSYGNTATANLQVSVTPVVPVAHDDAKSTAYLTPVTVGVLANDVQGATSAPLDATSVVITTSGTTDGGKALATSQGTWSVDKTTGAITFTPNSGFTGDAVISYQVTDANGTTTTATVTVTVNPPAAPSAVADTNHTPYLTPVTTSVLANDTAHGLATLQPASVKLTGSGASPDGTSLTNADGSYTVNPSGTVRFTPASGFSGTASPVTYQVSDELGQVGTATLTVTVGTPPVAADNATTTLQGIPVTITELGNDTPGTDGAGTSGTLDAASVVFTSGSAVDHGRTLAVAGEGTWTIDAASGTATFAPLAGFSGPATPVGYRVTDSFGNTADAVLKVTVTAVSPGMVSDAGHQPYDTPVVVDVLANDTPGDPLVPLDATTVVIVSPDSTDGGRTLVTDDGTWTVNRTTGAVTFTPADGFSGTPDPVTYRVADANGTTRTATVTVTVGNPPDASDDAAVTPHDTTVTLSPLANDAAGDNGAGVGGTLGKASLVFTSADATDGDHTLVVPGQGTWAIDPATGTVSFDPLPTFAGATASVQYRVTDSFGHDATAYLTVTVGAAPAAADDAATTPQNVTVTIATPLANDTAGDDGAGVVGSLDPASVVFTSSGATDSGRKLTTSDGVWTIDPATGAVTFDPEPGYVGTTKPVGYAVTDSHGNTAKADWTVTVTPITPTADDDANHAPYGTASVTTTVLDGDNPGAASAQLVPGSVVITTAGASADGKSLTVAPEGTWTVNPDGTIGFAPEPGFHGTATPIAYQVLDQNGTPATAGLTVTIGEPPAAADDYPATPQGVPVTFDPLADDLAGDDGTGVPGRGTLDPASVVFTSADATDGGRTLVIDGKGTFTIDPATGRVTFTPDPSFEGNVPAVTYAVTDSFGNTTTAKIHLAVAEIIPVAVNDTAATPANTAVTLPVLGNDTAGASTAPLQSGSVVITADGVSKDGKTLVTQQGTWKVNDSGTVTFTPADGFTGPTDPVQYRVTDANGTHAAATMTVTVGGLPKAVNDTGTTGQNVPVTVCPPCNDAAGNDGAGQGGSLVSSSVVFTDAAATDGGKKLATAEGTWTVNADGSVTFAPKAAFTGVTRPVAYAITDSFGNTAAATITVTVTPVTPAAANDTTTAPFGSPVTINILGNDQPGDGTAALDPTTLVFTDAAATDGGKTLSVPGEGTWHINADGTVTFTPVDGFTGTTSPVRYAVSDVNGTRTTASVVVKVAAGPAASDDQVKGTSSVVTVRVLLNDKAGDGATLVPGSVRLLGVDGTATASTKLVVTDEGTWTVFANGTLTFRGNTGFHGWTSWVTYQVTDSSGQSVTARARVWVPESSDSLAYTGTDVGNAIVWALLLVGAGFVLVLAGNRRRRGQRS